MRKQLQTNDIIRLNDDDSFHAVVIEVDETTNFLEVEVVPKEPERSSWCEEWNLEHTKVGLGISHGRQRPYYRIERQAMQYSLEITDNNGTIRDLDEPLLQDQLMAAITRNLSDIANSGQIRISKFVPTPETAGT